MRVFVAGATGVIGRALLPQLREAGHEVVAMTRSEERAAELRAGGSEAVVCDAFDAEVLARAVADARPDAVVNQLTDIPKALNPRKSSEQFEMNDRLRTEGSRNLMRAAEAAGVRRAVAQSIAFAYAPGPAQSTNSITASPAIAQPIRTAGQVPPLRRRCRTASR